MSRTARIRSTAECEFCAWTETLTEVVDESNALRTAANLEAEAEVRLREHLVATHPKDKT